MRFEVETNLYNPSALAKKFSSIQTNFDVTLGKISAIISDSDIEQYQDGHTTMNSRLSSAIQDLDGFHQQVSKMQITYDGQFESVDNRLTTFDTTLNGITADVSSVSREAIKTDTIHYLATSASDGVTTSTYGWTTTPQSVTSTKRYLWIYHTYTKGDNSTTDSDPVIAGVWGNTGNKGDKGDSGVSISGVTNYYLATSSSSGVTKSTSGWTTSIQTMTATNQYLWNYERITGSDGSTLSESEPVIIGRYGQNGGNGRGISSITEYYAVSSSNTTAPSVWANTMANTTTTNRYLWNYERIAYTDGTTADTTKRVIGTHGETGDDGVGITATTPLRYASSSSTTPSKPTSKVTSTSTAVGVWTTAIPALSNTYKYMFTCDQIEWDNGTITWSTVVQDNALTDLVTRVASAELKITEDAIVATVRSSDSYKGDLASKNATFTGDYIPTTSNAPASTWTTTALKESHLNDTFLTSGGELYQYISGHNGLMITFSSDSKTESVTYDYVRIYYKIGDTTYVLPDIGGTDISGASVFVPSNEFWLYWRSDRSQVYYGFRIASIDWVFSNTPTLTEATLPGIDPTPMSGTNYPETTHPYTNNEEKFWKYTHTGHSASVNPSYGWAKREDSGIRTLTERMSAAELKITDSAIVSTVTSSQFGQTVTSTIKQTSDGIYLDAKYVSWNSTYSSMTKDGKLTCTGGKIGGFTIGSSAIYNGISSVDATLGTGVYVGTDGINLGGGKFKVTSSGAFQWTATYSNMTSNGQLTCTGGKIGGFTISASALYNGISSMSATSGTGVYVGTDGINLGGGKFKVTSSGDANINGILTAYGYVSNQGYGTVTVGKGRIDIKLDNYQGAASIYPFRHNSYTGLAIQAQSVEIRSGDGSYYFQIDSDGEILTNCKKPSNW